MTSVELSFVDLERFLIKDMKMQANYQPIMIRTLLNSPQRIATKDEIAEKIRDLNSDANNKDFKNIPVYEVLTNRGIVKKDGNKFLLNIGELSDEQTYQLSVLCNWKTQSKRYIWTNTIFYFCMCIYLISQFIIF
jgi:hypothetical protein